MVIVKQFFLEESTIQVHQLTVIHTLTYQMDITGLVRDATAL